MKTTLLCVMLSILCLALTVFTPVMADEIVTAPEPTIQPITEIEQAESIPALVYQGVKNGFDKLVDISQSGRKMYGVNFSDSDNLVIGQEWSLKEFDIIKDNKLVLDLAMGYVVTEIDVDGTETTNDDVDTAMITGSVNLTFKTEIDAKFAEFSNSGIGLWAGIDPNVEVGYGIKAHTQLDELFGVSTDNIFLQIGLSGLALLATD